MSGETLQVYFLGTAGALPTPTRNPSCIMVRRGNDTLLFDCGEGAQIQMRRFRLKFQRIDHIFISHLHGDHYLGLMGLLFTFHLLGRSKELHLYADHDLKEILDMQLEISQTTLVYPLVFHPIDSTQSENIYEDDLISVHTIPMDHRIPTVGFLFREKPKDRKIKKEILNNVNIPVEVFEKIKKGNDFTDDKGRHYKNSELTTEGPVPVTYAYCSDTGYTESYLPLIKGVDLLYHEATFLHDKVKNAREKFHCTAFDAAQIANKAKVKKLMIGHYSARYDDLNPLLEEASSIFENTVLAEEGKMYEI